MSNYWTRRRVSRRSMLRGAAVGAAGISGAVLIGCGDDDEDPTATAEPGGSTSTPAAGDPTEAPTEIPAPGADPSAGILLAPGEPKRGGKVTTTFWGRISNFDQHASGNRGIQSQMYESIVRANPLDGLQTIIPRLATSWEIADGTSYTFKTREGVEFHDGTPMTAEDVAMSLRRMRKLGEFTDGTSRYGTDLDMLESAEAVDETTVKVELNAPRAYFLEMLADPGKVVYSQTHINDDSLDITAAPLPGTGPFVFEQHLPEELTRFSANRNYWNPELPYIDELEMLHTVAWPDRATAILGGQADYANIVPAEFFDTREQFSDTAGVARHDGTRASLQFYMHNEKEPFNDTRVRRAIFLAVNRPALIDVYPESMSLAGSRWVSNSSPVATPLEQIQQIPGYRGEDEEAIAEAKKLMAAAGVADGFGDKIIVSNTNASHSEILAPAFQAELKSKLNIDTTLDPRAGSGRTEAYQDGTFDFLLGVIFRAPVSEFVTAWKAAIRTGGANNFELYSDPEVDDIIDKIDNELDPAAKKDLLRAGHGPARREPAVLPGRLHAAQRDCTRTSSKGTSRTSAATPRKGPGISSGGTTSKRSGSERQPGGRCDVEVHLPTAAARGPDPVWDLAPDLRVDSDHPWRPHGDSGRRGWLHLHRGAATGAARAARDRPSPLRPVRRVGRWAAPR